MTTNILVAAQSKMSQVHTTVACRSIDKAVDSLVAQLGGIINRIVQEREKE